jgi:hypothetical protein
MSDQEQIVVHFVKGDRGFFGISSDDNGPYTFLDRNANHAVEITERGDYVVEITNPGRPGRYRFCRVVSNQAEAARIRGEHQLAETAIREMRKAVERSRRDAVVEPLKDAITKQLHKTGVKGSTTLKVNGCTCEVTAYKGIGRKVYTVKPSFICLGSVTVYVPNLPDDMPGFNFHVDNVPFYGQLSLGCKMSA